MTKELLFLASAMVFIVGCGWIVLYYILKWHENGKISKEMNKVLSFNIPVLMDLMRTNAEKTIDSTMEKSMKMIRQMAKEEMGYPEDEEC